MIFIQSVISIFIHLEVEFLNKTLY